MIKALVSLLVGQWIRKASQQWLFWYKGCMKVLGNWFEQPNSVTDKVRFFISSTKIGEEELKTPCIFLILAKIPRLNQYFCDHPPPHTPHWSHIPRKRVATSKEFRSRIQRQPRSADRRFYGCPESDQRGDQDGDRPIQCHFYSYWYDVRFVKQKFVCFPWNDLNVIRFFFCILNFVYSVIEPSSDLYFMQESTAYKARPALIWQKHVHLL